MQRLQRQGFVVRGLGAGALCGEEALLDAADEFFGAFADLILLARRCEWERNLVALPIQFEGAEASQDAIELFGRAFREDHHEFVVVEPNGEVGAANDGTHARGEFAQSLIAGFAPEAFVDLPELSEIEHDEREGMAHALGAGDFGGKALLGETAIVEAGERIEHRQIAKTVELRVLIGELSVQLLDQKFLANRINVEQDDQRHKSEDGFGEADFEEGAGSLVAGHHGERDDRADHQEADKNRIAAQRRVALFDQRQFALKLVLAGGERGWDRVDGRSRHVEGGA